MAQFCTRCGAQMGDQVGYCPSCGVSVSHTLQVPTTRNASRLIPIIIAPILAILAAFLLPRLISHTSAEGQAAVQHVADESPVGKWQVSDEINPMDNSREVSVSLEAEDQVESFAFRQRPVLIVRCHQMKTEPAINFTTVIQSDFAEIFRSGIRFKFDDGQPIREIWAESTGLTGLFSPSPVLFARHLANAKTLLVEFTPFTGKERNIRFDVAGFGKYLPLVAQACHWTEKATVSETKAEPRSVPVGTRNEKSVIQQDASALDGSLLNLGDGPTASITPPSVVSRVEPEYTDEARAARIQGTVVLETTVLPDGTTVVHRVVRGLGFGLDEKAIEAIKQWRFRPGMREGNPVPVTLNVEVNFNLR